MLRGSGRGGRMLEFVLFGMKAAGLILGFIGFMALGFIGFAILLGLIDVVFTWTGGEG